MIFRRPELEKDNPIAPQPYIGPRRRLAMARAAALEECSEEAEENEMKKALRTLTRAAARYVESVPKTRKTEKSLKVLRDAIAQADLVLAVESRQ